jgi:hypothetical protein
MSFRAYFWRLVRHSFQGAFRVLEISEAIGALIVHVTGYFVHEWKDSLEVLFVAVVALFVLTFFVGLIFAAHAIQTDSEKQKSALEAKISAEFDAKRSLLENERDTALGEAKALRFEKESNRTTLSFFLKPQEHYRAALEWRTWTIGIRNNNPKVPLKNVSVKILEVRPQGKFGYIAAGELRNMRLQPTHMAGKSVIETIRLEEPFDVVADSNQEQFARVAHATLRDGSDQVERNWGHIEKGVYLLKLRAESENADPVEAEIFLAYSDEELRIELQSQSQK